MPAVEIAHGQPQREVGIREETMNMMFTKKGVGKMGLRCVDYKKDTAPPFRLANHAC